MADKLMAALQGANVVGDDWSCVSSFSAFLRVAKPENDPDSLYLDLNVAETPYGVEPIDELQVLYDEWLNWVSVNNPDAEPKALKLYPNPAKNFIHYQINRSDLKLPIALQITDLQDKMNIEMIIIKRYGLLDISGIANWMYVISRLIDGEKY